MKLSLPSPTSSAADDLLRQLIPQAEIPQKGSRREKLAAILDNRGLTVETIADKLHEQLYSQDKVLESRALEQLMRIHNVLPKEDQREVPQIVLNIQGSSTGPNPLMGILTPQRS